LVFFLQFQDFFFLTFLIYPQDQLCLWLQLSFL